MKIKMLGIITVLALSLGAIEMRAANPDPLPIPEPSQQPTAADREHKADLARMRKDYYNAEQIYLSLLSKDKNNAVLWNKLGITQLKAGEFGDAKRSLQRAVKAKPDYADAINNLGAVNLLQKKFDAALKYFKQALALNETKAVYHLNIGEAWFNKKQFDRAMFEYARALELDPDVLDSATNNGVSAMLRTREQQASFSYLIAKTYLKHGNPEEALKRLEMARDLGYPKMGDVYTDKDFSSLWGNPRLKQIIGK